MNVTPQSTLHPLVAPAPELRPDETERYSRNILLPEVGIVGQRRLKNARVLVIGAGGLGSPVLLYLAAAGVGTIGIVDDDRVEASNLQRQVIHGMDDVGRLKVDSARDALHAINPLVRVEVHPLRLSGDNAVALFQQYDLIVDGADNFATRYLVSDAAEVTAKPCVWGSILRFGAQVSVFWSTHGPTYRDLYPDAPPPESAPSCGEAGVLGMLCGVAGSMMAAEAIKLIVGAGRSLLGRLSIFDLAAATWRELRILPDPARCPVTHVDSAHGGCVVTEAAARGREPITTEELRELLSERASGRAAFDLVDVREPDEYERARIDGSRSAPLSRLRRDGCGGLALAPEHAVVLYCKAGPRAHAAAEILREAGHADIRLLTGGFDQWIAESVVS
ncbi:molybdopterin-synthase adenylyltransferase MoeB [Microbacterium allomyrinae]|uniref:Molybdopterin-synthase adenylyltransferase MoeB n=1 Tax=Microbacterium allomyrinae TaxID=2830666 RepID=A0A9X1LVJ7_9MICO|nr:molybdopterin-synthase adenylyltransferase MoeB [Microbacterium allomyrinae]MCC2032830.1 molybdopterin-synthase adenylyltransferase MoeB [Microbacterium allomyrinae]